MMEPQEVDILGVKVTCVSFTLQYNEHLTIYASVLEYYDEDDIREGNLSNNSAQVYKLYIYPNTPIGFVTFTASSLEDLIAQLKAEYSTTEIKDEK